MTSTKRHRTLCKRAVQCLGATGFAIGIAVGSAGLANAQPSWDIGSYDECMLGAGSPAEDPAGIAEEQCCIDSGGVVTYPNGGGPTKCVAPPGEPAASSQSPIFNRPIPSQVLTRVPSVPLPPQQLPGGPLPQQVDG